MSGGEAASLGTCRLKPVACSLFACAHRRMQKKDGVPLPLGGPGAIRGRDSIKAFVKLTAQAESSNAVRDDESHAAR
jgi:hypothetical protein